MKVGEYLIDALMPTDYEPKIWEVAGMDRGKVDLARVNPSKVLVIDPGLMKCSFEIRRVAVEQRIPCCTSLDTAQAVVEVLLDGATRFNVLPHREYLEFPLILTEEEQVAGIVLDAALAPAKEEAG